MTDTTAQILSKGCQATGITEELARKYHDNLGTHVMAIVELKATSRTEDADGKESVKLTILSVEPAPDPSVASHLRDLQRAMYHARKLDSEDEQPQLDGVGAEPTVEEVLAHGQAMLPQDQGDDCRECEHPLADDAITHQPDDGPCVWAACGHVVHTDAIRCTKKECQDQEAAQPQEVGV